MSPAPYTSVHMRRACDTHLEHARAQLAILLSRTLLFSTGWLQQQSNPKDSTEDPEGPGALSEPGSTTQELNCNIHREKQQQRDKNVNHKSETCKPSLSNTSQKRHEGHYGFYTVLFKVAECTDCWQLSDSFKCCKFQRKSPDKCLFRSLYLVWFDSKKSRG